jgi:D-amino-acid dehydrogenase
MLDPLGPLAVRALHAPKLIPWLIRFAKVSTPRETERISQALSAINTRVYNDLLPMLAAIGMERDLHRNGALSVYESELGFQRDATEWDQKRAHGIIAEEMTGNEARQIEPALGQLVRRAVFTPQWSYVSDPKRIVDGLRHALLQRDVIMIKNSVRHIRPGTRSTVELQTEGGSIETDTVVIAAGAWSGTLVRHLGERVLLESERGYNMTLPHSGISLKHQLIFAERKFVATPLRCGLRIGGAAEFGGLYAAANFKRSQTLVDLARRYLPQLRTDEGVSWAGHRPATPDSLPVISRSRLHANVYYAFGHGHLGLTQAATTGRLIRDLVFQKQPPIDMSPYGIDRFR